MGPYPSDPGPQTPTRSIDPVPKPPRVVESELNKGEKGHRARANEGRNERGALTLGSQRAERKEEEREKDKGSAQRLDCW